MAFGSNVWYFSNMTRTAPIPAFGLYGEQDQFPDVVHCESFSARAPEHDWQILAHRHSQMSQLFMVSDGWIEARVDGVPYRLEPFCFLYVPPHCVHEFTFKRKTLGGVVSFPLSVVTSIGPNASDIMQALSKPIFGYTPKRLGQLVDILREAWRDNSPFRTQQSVGLAHSILSYLASFQFDQQIENYNSKPQRLFELDALIAAHHSDGWAANQYADALSISTGHLSRLCRSATGVGAAAYIEQRTMDEACRLLAFTQLSISEIGYRLGYNDPSYFSKRFRSARGQTPSDFREPFKS